MCKKKYDVAIVGASVAGLFAAYLLVSKGITVAIFDNSVKNPRRKACGEALSLLGKQLLEEQGLWSDCFSSVPLFGYQIAFDDLLKANSNIVTIKHWRPLVWGIDKLKLVKHIKKLILSSELCDLFNMPACTYSRVGQDLFDITTADITITANTIIFAGGSNNLKKFEPAHLYYKQASTARTGFACWLKGAWKNQTPNLVTIVDSVEGQWIATPTGNNSLNISALLNNSIHNSNNKKNFLIEKAQKLAEKVGFITTEVDTYSGAARIQESKLINHPVDIYIIGDALHRHDPVSGMGMTHALITASLAANKIINNKLSGLGLSSSSHEYFKSSKSIAASFRVVDIFCYKLLVERNMILIKLTRMFPRMSAVLLDFYENLIYKLKFIIKINISVRALMVKLIIILTLLYAFHPTVLYAESIEEKSHSRSHWFLPKRISTNNAEMKFSVDSTWHTIHGSTTYITGLAKLKNISDPTSVYIEIAIPVAKLDTDNSSRDKKLRKVMYAKEYKTISFIAEDLLDGCMPETVLLNETCNDRVKAKLKIIETEKEIFIPIQIHKTPTGFSVKGQFEINWEEFGIADPSILIARVDRKVTINFNLSLDE